MIGLVKIWNSGINMDIQDLNRFALNAITAAILIFHTEIVSASCPTQIAGTALENTVCDFDAGSSVTVLNGGKVAGINMSGYNPSSPSSIVIDAGGIIDNNLAGVAINISASMLSNGIANNGTINSASDSGIIISNSSTINGGLSNTGSINSGNGGINIIQSTISGGIFNSGIINSSGTGLRITTGSSISGGISNSGTISAGGVDVGIAILNNSIVEGGINNTGLIEATSGNGIVMYNSSTINGGISNSGTIRSASNEGISFLNGSRVLGDILNNGTISGGQRGLSIHNSAVLNGSILNNGTISGENERGIAIFSIATITGSISNGGTIRGGNTGIAVASSSTINGGISNSGTIQGDIFAIRVTDSVISDGINILGKSARIIGDVEAFNTNFNIQSGAIFTSEGNIHVDNFNIGSNAIFNMQNGIITNTLNNSGTLSISNSLQTLTGDYIQNTGGLFQIGASSATNYGQLFVTGTVDLTESGDIYVQVAQNATLHAGDILNNVINGNTLIIPTGGFNVSDNSFIWKFIADINPGNTGVNLTATIDQAAYGACLGSFCEGAGRTIIGQVAAGNPLFGPFALLSTKKALKTAAIQATPELTNENIQVTQLVTRSVMDIVPMWGTLHGQSAGDAMLYQPGKIWVKPYGGSLNQNESDSVDGFNATLYGFVIGKDIEIADEWLLGGAFAFGKDNLKGKSDLDGQKINTDDYQAMIYASKRLPHHLYFAGQGLIGYGNNDTKRSIPLYASTAHGSYNSWFANLRSQLGWNAYSGHNLTITPEIDASYLFINQGSYEESGSPMDLEVSSNNNSSLVLGVYAHAALQMPTLKNQYDVTLTGYVGASHDVLNDEPETTATFIAGGPSFTTSGVQLNEFVFRGGAGLAIENPTKPLKVNLNYDLQAGNNAYSGMGSITFLYKI